MSKLTDQSDENFDRALQLIISIGDLLEVSRNLTILWNAAYKNKDFAAMDRITKKRRKVAERMLEV